MSKVEPATLGVALINIVIRALRSAQVVDGLKADGERGPKCRRAVARIKHVAKPSVNALTPKKRQSIVRALFRVGLLAGQTANYRQLCGGLNDFMGISTERKKRQAPAATARPAEGTTEVLEGPVEVENGGQAGTEEGSTEAAAAGESPSAGDGGSSESTEPAGDPPAGAGTADAADGASA